MTKEKQRISLIKALQFEGLKDADKHTKDMTLEEMTKLLNKMFMERQEREGHLDFLKHTGR